MAKKEKSRKLTAAEARRLAHFETLCADLQSQGYKKTDLTISMTRASVAVIIAIIPLSFVFIGLFVWLNPDTLFKLDLDEIVLLILAIIALTIAHEFVHGITWSLFSEHGMKDIEFGIMWNTLSPYCTCASALPRSSYIIGALMPLVVTGLVPTVIALAIGSPWLLALGFVMTLSAGGDIMIVFKLLAHHSDANEILWYDHPTEGGGVIFER